MFMSYDQLGLGLLALLGALGRGPLTTEPNAAMPGPKAFSPFGLDSLMGEMGQSMGIPYHPPGGASPQSRLPDLDITGIDFGDFDLN